LTVYDTFLQKLHTNIVGRKCGTAAGLLLRE